MKIRSCGVLSSLKQKNCSTIFLEAKKSEDSLHFPSGASYLSRSILSLKKVKNC